jgi:hypothetical protein
MSRSSLANLPPSLSHAPPPTPTDSVADSGLNKSTTSVISQQPNAPLTPAPSPGGSSHRQLWNNESGEGGSETDERGVGGVQPAELQGDCSTRQEGFSIMWSEAGRPGTGLGG